MQALHVDIPQIQDLAHIQPVLEEFHIMLNTSVKENPHQVHVLGETDLQVMDVMIKDVQVHAVHLAQVHLAQVHQVLVHQVQALQLLQLEVLQIQVQIVDILLTHNHALIQQVLEEFHIMLNTNV